jgi:hypothetical protein
MKTLKQAGPIHAISPKTVTPWYAQRWPWLLMLGPMTVVLAGLFTAWLAFTYQDALVVDDYYKAGKAINQDLRRDHEAVRRGINGSLHYDAAQGVLSGVLHNLRQPVNERNAEKNAAESLEEQGAAALGAGLLQLRLIHSTLPAKDILLNLHADPQGNFSVALPLLDAARWQVLVEDRQGQWRLHGNWIWPQQAAIDLRPETITPAQP